MNRRFPATRARVFFDTVDANAIFGMVGRCGGGYNTVWEDWSIPGQQAREQITKEYEEGLNKICGHYDKLEKSILAEGFRNPLIITCGPPVKKKPYHLPPHLRGIEPEKLLLLEGVTGGSRLWVAQKYNLKVPCLINDFTGKYIKGIQVLTSMQAVRYYKDPPAALRFDRYFGVSETYENNKSGYHLGPEWSEDRIVKQRAPLWVSIMNKYGYYVDRLQPNIHAILAEAGVVQPDNLKKRFISRGT
jgi:hypothetical protein